MATIEITDPAREVLNQPPALQPANLFELDVALGEALEREGGGWGAAQAREAGAVAGSVEAREHSRRAERNEPRLTTHDRYGNRIDAVELDPSWHWLLEGAVARGIHSLPWREPRPGAHVVRAALFTLWSNANDGVMCPVSMTYAAVPALRDGAPELAAEWEPRLTLPDYERGALSGMAMTERQGGSDVRANITRAEPLGDGGYELHGHKWFCSYPPCDVFLVLAQAPGGTFVLPGGTRRRHGVPAPQGQARDPLTALVRGGVPRRPGPARGRGGTGRARDHPHGQPHAVGLPAGLDHRAAPRHARGHPPRPSPHGVRRAPGRPAGDAQRARRSGHRVRGGHGDGDARGACLRRAVGVGVSPVCHRGDANTGCPSAPPATPPRHSNASGGNGFVEDSGMPLLYRDAPLNSIWEGSGNVAALDVLRAIVKEPEGLPAFLAECDLAAGAEPRLDAHLAGLRERLQEAFAGADGADAAQRLYAGQFGARRLVEDLAVALQASLLVRHAPPAVADAFCAGRLEGDRGRVYGTLPAGVDAKAIIERAVPV